MSQPPVNWAALPKQTILAEFDNNDYSTRKAGDCWRCCIAAVLGLPAAEVPHFLQESYDSIKHDHKGCDELTQEWLAARGYSLARIHGHLSFDYAWKLRQPPVIKCGPSPRSRKMHQHHAVVYVNDEMVYDPHPDNTGLTAISDQYLIIKL